MEQGTQEWFEARLGRVTGSRIKDVRATVKSGGESASRRNYRAQLVVERLTGTREETFTNDAMRWGTEVEPIARAAYEIATGNDVEQVGIINHPTIPMTAASPDGLVGEDGMLEIKCPTTATHIAWLLSGKVPAEHRDQMLWQMDCSGREWCDFVSYDPRMPEGVQLFLIRFEKDEQELVKIRAEVEKFLTEVDAEVESLQKIANGGS